MAKINMGICKENELCEPFACRKAYCSIGENLRNLSKFSKCKDGCILIKQGINGVNSCKDASCPIGNIIVEFKSK